MDALPCLWEIIAVKIHICTLDIVRLNDYNIYSMDLEIKYV